MCNPPDDDDALEKARLWCPSCGKTTSAVCGCGVGYITAGERAAEAIRANPERTDRAIAAELGISNQTVKRARPGVTNVTPLDRNEKRIGRDGKSYPVKQTRPRAAEDDAVPQPVEYEVFGGKIMLDREVPDAEAFYQAIKAKVAALVAKQGIISIRTNGFTWSR